MSPRVAAFAAGEIAGSEVLSPTEARLLAAIVEAPTATQEDLAKVLKLSARHVRRLMARAHMRRAMDAAARAGLDAGAAVLGRGATKAAQSLLDMAIGGARATSARVAACRAVLDGAGRLIDLVDLERRIGGLEQAGHPPAGWGQPQ